MQIPYRDRPQRHTKTDAMTEAELQLLPRSEAVVHMIHGKVPGIYKPPGQLLAKYKAEELWVLYIDKAKSINPIFAKWLTGSYTLRKVCRNSVSLKYAKWSIQTTTTLGSWIVALVYIMTDKSGPLRAIEADLIAFTTLFERGKNRYESDMVCSAVLKPLQKNFMQHVRTSHERIDLTSSSEGSSTAKFGRQGLQQGLGGMLLCIAQMWILKMNPQGSHYLKALFDRIGQYSSMGFLLTNITHNTKDKVVELYDISPIVQQLLLDYTYYATDKNMMDQATKLLKETIEPKDRKNLFTMNMTNKRMKQVVSERCHEKLGLVGDSFSTRYMP